jgi:hypothetical protein
VNRHERKQQDRLFSLLEQVLANQNRLLEVWLGSVGEASSTQALDERSFEDEYLVRNLQEAAALGDEEAQMHLSDQTSLRAYLAQFRD